MLVPPRGQRTRLSISIPLASRVFSQVPRSSARIANAKCSGPLPSCGPSFPKGSCVTQFDAPRLNKSRTLRPPTPYARNLVSPPHSLKAEDVLVETRRAVEIIHVQSRLDHAGERRHARLLGWLETFFD